MSELPDNLEALAKRAGAKGPHLDKSDATFEQLAEWSEGAARNLDTGWNHPEIFPACLGGWEANFLRHVAKEFRNLTTIIATLEAEFASCQAEVERHHENWCKAEAQIAALRAQAGAEGWQVALWRIIDA